jgi:2-(1,2-epoxy-1,2-dihydrophenyl)acetyl-CoA isomerase
MIRTSTAGSVTTITLDRPEKLNAFSGTMREDLLAALREAEGHVVVITGAGRAFCAGGDVEFMSLLQKVDDTERFRSLLDAGRDVVMQIATMAKPVIAAVNGVAAGAGCNLALACDYRIASDAAKFSESFVRIGLHPDWGGSWLLPRLAGTSRAFEMMATGRMVAAEEALSIGLIDRVVAAEELAGETETLANAIATAPPALIADMKRALAASRTNTLGAQIELESEHQLRAFQSDEARQRIMAFLKRA